MSPTFQTRFQDAARYAGVEFSPTAIGRSLGVSKQKAQYWMTTGEPKASMVFRIADSWHVDARWLATGQGTMLPPPSHGSGLSIDEIEMIRRYRRAEPRNRPSILAVARTLGKTAALLVFLGGSLQFDITKSAHAFARQDSVLITHCRAFWYMLVRALAISNQMPDAAIA